MKCIIGLGNPGAQYAKNYHNIGMIFAKWLSEDIAKNDPAQNMQVKKASTYTSFKYADFYLIFPNEYMNLSFKALHPILALHKISIKNVLVMHDELMKKRGTLQIKNAGGNAGHNGLRSITEHIGNDFWRLQIGIDHPNNLGIMHSVSDYVLSNIENMDFYKELFDVKGKNMILDWLKQE